jgi:hypothetical protein
MKVIGKLSDGRMLLEAVPQEIVDLEEALRTVLLTVGTIRISNATTGMPDEAPAQMPAAPRRQERKPGARPAARGCDVYRRCEQCDEKLPADAAPQKRFCDTCVQKRKNACPSMQKRKAGPKKVERHVICGTCKSPFAARAFGPVPHHCPACRPGGKKATAAAPAPALQTPQKALRPPMPQDDAGKRARLERIRELDRRGDGLPPSVAAAVGEARESGAMP